MPSWALDRASASRQGARPLSNSISPASELSSDTHWTTLLTPIKGRRSNPQVSTPGRDSHGPPTGAPVQPAISRPRDRPGVPVNRRVRRVLQHLITCSPTHPAKLPQPGPRLKPALRLCPLLLAF